ncbi:MAG: hypothetical protein EZS28_042560 [Streblomastix strix]|uniref:Uncharacterized protein n=1 Tax=Streblomastix strix TaxID=222440 RepID=A0A5J4TVK6_9EUKA|nr:MAG: hypothetical protein EZS28_042560 [Streblomastix strix]
MSFAASDYIQKLAKVQHSDYVSTYSAMSEVLRQASIHPQSFTLSRQEFFDQPVSQMTSDGQRYTRAPLGARGNATCSMVQSCQVNWQITIPGERLALQLNLVPGLATPITTTASARARINFNGLANSQADYTRTMECGAEANFYMQSLAAKLILLTNFGSKILGGIKKVAGWVSPTLHKVMSTLAPAVGTLHPGIGGIMGTIGNVAGQIDRHLNKR